MRIQNNMQYTNVVADVLITLWKRKLSHFYCSEAPESWAPLCEVLYGLVIRYPALRSFQSKAVTKEERQSEEWEREQELV